MSKSKADPVTVVIMAVASGSRGQDFGYLTIRCMIRVKFPSRKLDEVRPVDAREVGVLGNRDDDGDAADDSLN